MSVVLPASEADKRTFLTNKGLSDHEIAAAFEALQQPASRSYPGAKNGTVGSLGRAPMDKDQRYYLNEQKSTIAIIAETVLLPVTATLGVVSVVNFFWVSRHVI